jgi:hypothetical protein
MFENVPNEILKTYFIAYYIMHSIVGLYFMQDYIRKCKEGNIVPFNNSLFKGFFMLIFCGLFTKIILFIGIIATIFDIFRKKI